MRSGMIQTSVTKQWAACYITGVLDVSDKWGTPADSQAFTSYWGSKGHGPLSRVSYGASRQPPTCPMPPICSTEAAILDAVFGRVDVVQDSYAQQDGARENVSSAAGQSLEEKTI